MITMIVKINPRAITYFFLFFAVNALITLNGYSQAGRPDSTSMSKDPGRSLLPVPKKVALSTSNYLIDESWSLETAGLSKNAPSVLSLTTELKERFGLRLNGVSGKRGHKIFLTINPGAVPIGQTIDTNRSSLKQQAYRLTLDQQRISVTANGAQGLFYGVQTLLQLLQQDKNQVFFAGGEITDWPDTDLRLIYWDDAHHLERLEALKRAIRQASYYKINAFSIKLEGHFQFSAAKAIVEPFAYTPAEFQELTDYAKAHYVELVPYLDAPAHIAFILKHPAYADLRAFPGSNYELDVMSPKADELILGMFDNLIQANKGGKYVILSTDEAYYVGMSVKEKKRAQELGGNGKLLAEYITRISNKLKEKGRKVIIWGEYPMMISDIKSLPSHLINGVYDDAWAPVSKEHGIRQLIYTATQGEEPLFPNYHKLPPGNIFEKPALAQTDDEPQQGDLTKGRVGEMVDYVTATIRGGKSDFMGTIVAAWADAGLNPETFWLGYATGSSVGWNGSNLVNAKELTSRFYNSFYGNRTTRMDRVYELLSNQAEFWYKSWDWELTKSRPPIFGYSAAIYDTPKPANDQTLALLPVPSSSDLSITEDWKKDNTGRIQAAEKFLKDNDELMSLLNENLIAADHQHYNLQVLRTVAQLCRQNLNMLLDLQRINNILVLASKTTATNPEVSLSLIDQALYQLEKIRNERNDVLQSVTSVWYQDWFPRVAEANGRKFLDQVDDVKDHPPARTVDMSYLIYRQLRYPLGKWAEEVVNARNQFAKKNNLPLRTFLFDWKSTE